MLVHPVPASRFMETTIEGLIQIRQHLLVAVGCPSRRDLPRRLGDHGTRNDSKCAGASSPCTRSRDIGNLNVEGWSLPTNECYAGRSVISLGACWVASVLLETGRHTLVGFDK